MAGFSAVVAGSGGDYTSINSAVAALVAGDSIYVKTGTYTGAEDVSKAVFVYIEPGTTFSHASGFTVSANKASVLIGNGSTITNALTISGTDCWFKARNGLTCGEITISGARGFLDGGGLGSVAEKILISADDGIVQNIAVDSKTPAGGNNAFQANGGTNGRSTFRNCKGIDSDVGGFSIVDPKCLVESCYVVDCDTHGIIPNNESCRVIGNHSTGSGANHGIYVFASGDNSVVVGNFSVTSSGSSVYVHGSGGDCAVVGNRCPNGITDDSASSTVADNDTT